MDFPDFILIIIIGMMENINAATSIYFPCSPKKYGTITIIKVAKMIYARVLKSNFFIIKYKPKKKEMYNTKFQLCTTQDKYKK